MGKNCFDLFGTEGASNCVFFRGGLNTVWRRVDSSECFILHGFSSDIIVLSTLVCSGPRRLFWLQSTNDDFWSETPCVTSALFFWVASRYFLLAYIHFIASHDIARCHGLLD